MASMTVTNFAIKLGIDPSSVPIDLHKVEVNLTSAQRRLARDPGNACSAVAADKDPDSAKTHFSQKAREMGHPDFTRAADSSCPGKSGPSSLRAGDFRKTSNGSLQYRVTVLGQRSATNDQRRFSSFDLALPMSLHSN
jgi:hypothetical protein